MLVDIQQSRQHRPTASERTEPRRSHAVFYCYSVNCSLCGRQITSRQLEQTFCVVLTKKNHRRAKFKTRAQSNLLSIFSILSVITLSVVVMSPICVENAVYIFIII